MVIKPKLYKIITDKLPIACVDICLINYANQILFIKRNEEPAIGQWWIPGGRIHIGETVEQAAIRIAKKEVNVDISDRNIHRIYYGETIFKNDDGKVIRHSLNAVVSVLMENKSIKNIKRDETSTAWDWHDNIITKIKHPYLLEILKILKI